jgi:hypothetical protein
METQNEINAKSNLSVLPVALGDNEGVTVA